MSLLGNILGVKLNLLIGPSPVALPMPLEALQGFEELEILSSDKCPSGFKLVIRYGRSGPLDFLESPLLVDPRLGTGARFIATAMFDFAPTVIFDGLVSDRQVLAGDRPKEGKIVLMGRDLSAEMNRESKQAEYPAMDESMIATLIALSYAQFGMIPMVLPPLFIDPPLPVDRTPQQNCSDWAYLRTMAARHGYETYVDPGPVPGTNTLYWGPAVRPGVPQRTLTVNSGGISDAYDIHVSNNSEDLTTVETEVADRLTGTTMPVMAMMPTRPPLGAVPGAVSEAGRTRTTRIETSGLSFTQAMARAQAEVDACAGEFVRITGTVDALRYNGALRARDQVFLRGVGMTFDGLYKVAEVRHRIKPGDYQQDFVLTRSELGSMSPVVLP